MQLMILRRRLRQLRHEMHWWVTRRNRKRYTKIQSIGVLHDLQAEEAQILTELGEFEPSIRYLPPARPRKSRTKNT